MRPQLLLPLLLLAFTIACPAPPNPDGGPDDGGSPVDDSGTPLDGGAPPDDGGQLPEDGGPSEFCGTELEAAPYSWCPTSDAFVGDPAWSVPVEVPAGALYCSTFEEGRLLTDEPGYKGELFFVPGSYRLPDVAGSYTAALPLCAQLAGADPLASDGSGSLTVEVNSFAERTYYRYRMEQPLSEGGARWTLVIDIELATNAASPTLPLDGQYHAPFPPAGEDALTFFAMLCEGESCDTTLDRRFFGPCGFDAVAPVTHVITFQGGEVELEMRIGESVASTEPAIFARAAGTLDGTAFVVEDYWRLVYNPEHHHFRRDFVVFFEEPIGAAAGLRVVDVDPYQPAPARVDTVDCSLSSLQERQVTAEVVQGP